MKAKQIAADFLRGTGCTAITILTMVIAAVIFSVNWNGSALILFAAAAVILYLNILLLRTSDRKSLIIRAVTAFLMYFPLLGICFLISRIQTNLVVINMDFTDLCFLLVIGFPAAIILMGIAAVYSAKQKTHPVIPLVLMYLLYAFFQADAFRLAMKHTLGTDWESLLGYTQYARSGFFELCALAVIHFAVIIMLNRKIKSGESKRPKLMTGLAAAMCLYTVFIAVTELARLTVYIRVRGLSERRIYAAWFAVILGIAFLILLVKQFVRRLPSAAIVTACAAVMFGMLYQSRPAARIAEYNIERYENGSLDELDIRMLLGLSDDAYTVMAQHEDTLRQAGQWDCYLEHAETRRHS